MGNQEFLGEIAITNSCKDFTVDDGGGADAVALTAGNYFIQGYTGETQLIEHMQVQIRALGAPYASATVTRSSSTGLITIDFDTGGTDIDIAWTDTALQTLLGYTGTQTGAESYTATNTPKGVWRPSEELVDYPGDLDRWWAPRSSSVVVLSEDGATYGNEGHELYEGVYSYDLLDDDEVRSTTSTVWESFEALWQNVVHEVRPVRVLVDRTAYADTDDYHTGFIVPPGADSGEPVTIGSFRKYAGRVYDSYNGFWYVSFKMIKQVDAS